jgi:hypothetical protein
MNTFFSVNANRTVQNFCEIPMVVIEGETGDEKQPCLIFIERSDFNLQPGSSRFKVTSLSTVTSSPVWSVRAHEITPA